MTLPRTTRRSLLAGMGLSLLPGLAHAGPGQTGAMQPGLDQIDTQIHRWLDEGVYPGAGLMILREGKLVLERYYGSYDTDSIVHVASAGKWVAAATIAAVVDDGLLGWDDPAGKFIDGLNPMMARATLRQLLSHTAGYPDYQPQGHQEDHYQTLTEAVEQIRPLAPDSAPGTHFLYGGLAMQVAGRMAEIASGNDWPSLFTRRIAAPLGLSAMAFTPVSQEQGFSPMLAGGLRTNLRDFIRFLSMIAGDGMFGNRRVLSTAAIAQMQRDQTGMADLPATHYIKQARALSRHDIYGLGEWRDEVTDGQPTLISSAGWAGAYPWIDRRSHSLGFLLAKVDVDQARHQGFNAFLSSPVMPWLTRDAFADADTADMRQGRVHIGNASLYWEERGQGTPLILLHGHSFDRTMWDPQMAALLAHFRVIRYDMRGYGRSSLPVEGQPFTHAADLVALMDALGIDKAHLLGLSLGGAVVTDMLALHPDRMLSAIAASGDIFADYPGQDEPWTQAAMDRRRKEIAALRAGGVWQFKRDWLDQLTAHGGSQAESIRPKLWEMISKWSGWQPLHVEPRLILGRAAPVWLKRRKVSVPTLIMTPETDAGRPNALAALLPQARQIVIADAGHVSNLEQPDAFSRTVLGFLKG